MSACGQSQHPCAGSLLVIEHCDALLHFLLNLSGNGTELQVCRVVPPAARGRLLPPLVRASQGTGKHKKKAGFTWWYR